MAAKRFIKKLADSSELLTHGNLQVCVTERTGRIMSAQCLCQCSMTLSEGMGILNVEGGGDQDMSTLECPWIQG